MRSLKISTAAISLAMIATPIAANAAFASDGLVTTTSGNAPKVTTKATPIKPSQAPVGSTTKTQVLKSVKEVTGTNSQDPVNEKATKNVVWGWINLSSETCNVGTQGGTPRTTFKTVNRDFVSTGAIATENRQSSPVQLSQTLSATQKLTFSVNAGFNGSYQGIGGNVGGGAAYEVQWTTGQTIGPYAVQPNSTGRAVYGFNVYRFTGLQQVCTVLGKWTMPYKIFGVAPIEAAVVMQAYPTNESAPPLPGSPLEQTMAGLTPIAKN